MKAPFVFVLAALPLLGLVGCGKDDTSGQSKFEVRLTDAPGDFKAVTLDVRGVEIHVDEDESVGSWQALPLLTTGPLNILDFVNGKSALLVSADWPAGRISQIRLLLGPNNTVTTRDNKVLALKTPSGQTSGVKLKIDADLRKDVTYQLLLDFDVAKSIVERGNGSDRYLLKPVIRTVTTAVAGGIKGHITTAVSPQVLAIRTAAPIDTFSTYPDASNNYLVRGLSAGTYRVEFWRDGSKYQSATREVGVTNDRITDMGDVAL